MTGVKAVAIGVLVLSTLGCGAILHGTTQDVGIMAPSGATVQVGDRIVQGPSTVRLDRNRSYSVLMTKNGKTRPCGQITSNLSGGIFAVDILLLFPLGLIDAMGGWNYLEPTQIMCLE